MKIKLLIVLSMLAGGLFFPVRAMAAPHFTLTPASANETTNQNFTVMMGVDSETEKVIGIDIQGTFDAAKLQIQSVEKVASDTGYQFTYTSGQAIIHNDTGKFEVTLPSVDSSVYTGVVAKQDLLKITFKPITSGVATLNYVCTAGSVADTNIINQSGNDVVDCATNQSGSYTIADGNGTSPTSTPIPTSAPGGSTTTAPTAIPTVTGQKLPETGGLENTIALMVLGISGMMAAWYLKSL
jgi:hypothetical protein